MAFRGSKDGFLGVIEWLFRGRKMAFFDNSDCKRIKFVCNRIISLNLDENTCANALLMSL